MRPHPRPRRHHPSPRRRRHPRPPHRPHLHHHLRRRLRRRLRRNPLRPRRRPRHQSAILARILVTSSPWEAVDVPLGSLCVHVCVCYFAVLMPSGSGRCDQEYVLFVAISHSVTISVTVAVNQFMYASPRRHGKLSRCHERICFRRVIASTRCDDTSIACIQANTCTCT